MDPDIHENVLVAAARRCERLRLDDGCGGWREQRRLRRGGSRVIKRRNPVAQLVPVAPPGNFVHYWREARSYQHELVK